MKKWLLLGLVLLGFVLRIVGLSNHPVGFTPDETSFGYDAYSILKTGKDQWGNVFPSVFKSFGDDKLPTYVYLSVPSVAVFGLNEFSVRLPNAILGTLSIIVVYFFVKEIFKDEKLSLFSAFLLCISPWHIMLSRGAFEANLTSFFLTLAILFFLKSFKKPRLLGLSFLIFLINIFTYHTARILTPAILLFLVFNFRKELKQNRTFNIAFIFSVVLLALSIIGIFMGGSRLTSSGIFDINYSDDRYFAQVVKEPGVIAKIFYNKPIYIAKQFLINYFSYFSPQFLLTNGPAEGTYGMVPGVGVVYFVEVIFLFGFFWKIGREKIDGINLFLFWLLISPIPASLTKGPGYAANRVAIAIIPLIVIISIGGIFIYKKLETKKLKKVFVLIYSLLLIFNFLYVFEKYWVGQTVNQASAMVFGTKEVVDQVSNLPGTIVVSKNISEPQIYFAFYTKMDPIEYQNSSKSWNLVNGWVDQQGEYSLGKFTFRNINYSVDVKLSDTILVGTPNDFPPEIKPSTIVSFPNIKPAYYIVVNK